MRTLALVPLLAGCAPSFADDDWLITSARVIAVSSEPAEARPGRPLLLSALVAVPTTAEDSPELRWRLCDAPKPSTENNAVSSACQDTASLGPATLGTSVMLATLRDACSRFGPDTPGGGLRPRAPDASGGYYQPVRVDLEGAAPLFHLSRIQCGLAYATSETATAYAAEYLPNTNPSIEAVAASVDGQRVAFDAIPAGKRVVLNVQWTRLVQETYVYLDTVSKIITSRREAMRVNWYADAGVLETAANQQSEDNTTLHESTVWTAPVHRGPARLWVVLRDTRGGTAALSTDVRVVR